MSTSISTSSPRYDLAPSAPQTIHTPLQAQNPSSPMPAISTSKEWTIPPRPKPGRKPALDAPPTRRKTQNREAQRAFRERRAAKVCELEEQMKAMEEEDTREQKKLGAIISRLHQEVEEGRNLLDWYKKRCSELEELWAQERQIGQRTPERLQLSKVDTERHVNAVEVSQPEQPDMLHGVKDTSTVTAGMNPVEPTDLTCGRCMNDTRCKCIDEALEMSSFPPEGGMDTGQDERKATKRAYSPQSPTMDGHKRLREDDGPDEVDFTAAFARPKPSISADTSTALANDLQGSAAGESCGFCDVNTTCICAEIYRQDHSQKEPATLAVSESCMNTPGSCSQCQGDSKSTLFCKSLASTRPCIQPTITGSEHNDADAVAATSTTGPTLTCADAYTTLARHPAFSQASNKLGAWVPQLARRSVPTTSRNTPILQGKTAFEIEAASVMSVIKFFDRTYGDGDLNSDDASVMER